MEILKGVGVSSGKVSGTIFYIQRAQIDITKEPVSNIEAELQRFESARDKALAELKELYEYALDLVGEEEAKIFSAHQMMVEDLDFNDTITGLITDESANAEYAVKEAANTFAEMFESMEDEYMRARSADIRDISHRLIGILDGKRDLIQLDHPAIIAADDLTPSETITIERKNILAIITAEGSSNSHTAILSRTLGIPAVLALGAKLNPSANGKFAVVDADNGEVILQPDENGGATGI